MPEFKEHHGEVDPPGTDATRATARLPGLDIEIVHRRVAEDDAEHISIHLTAAPSFAAFGRAFEAANPFAFWAQGAQLVWLPWIEMTRALVTAWPFAPLLAGRGRPGSHG